MIIEGILTSLDESGRVNVAPMGPIVIGDYDRLILRPFQTSTTFVNLNARRQGVFHVVDDVDLIARAAIGRLDQLPVTNEARAIRGAVLADCCRWFEFEVESVDTTDLRSVMPARVVFQGQQRAFHGLNRARNAILEAAVIATRLHLLDPDFVRKSMEFLRPAVERTGDERDRQLFEMLFRFVLGEELNS